MLKTYTGQKLVTTYPRQIFFLKLFHVSCVIIIRGGVICFFMFFYVSTGDWFLTGTDTWKNSLYSFLFPGCELVIFKYLRNVIDMIRLKIQLVPVETKAIAECYTKIRSVFVSILNFSINLFRFVLFFLNSVINVRTRAFFTKYCVEYFAPAPPPIQLG